MMQLARNNNDCFPDVNTSSKLRTFCITRAYYFLFLIPLSLPLSVSLSLSVFPISISLPLVSYTYFMYIVHIFIYSFIYSLYMSIYIAEISGIRVAFKIICLLIMQIAYDPG